MDKKNNSQRITSIRDEYNHHTYHDPHKRASRLSDIILGGQDGLVNVLGIILGMAAASGDSWLVVVAGLAATFAESVSMGAVAYTSTLADADFYESELEREYRHIKEVPKLEKEEIRQIYAEKGFEGELLERIVNTITANSDIWVAVMMAEEHQLTPVNRKTAFQSAIVVGVSAIIGSLIPILPFFFFPIKTSMILAVVVSALVLFTVGNYKARITVGDPKKSGIEMTIIGILSALVGYLVGLLLKTPV